MVVALAADLLGPREQRLDALAQLHQRVARVGLLDDAGDQLAHPVLVLVVHHVALRLADALEDHLLGGLRGDPAEVLGGHVTLVDLVAVLGQLLLGQLGLLGLAQLAGIGIDLALDLLALLLALCLGLGEQLLLEVGRQQQLEDLEVARLVVHVDARVLGRAGALLVCREERVLEGVHERVGSDSLLLLEHVNCVNDLLAHSFPPPSCNRLLRLISVYGIETRPPSAATVTSSSVAPTSSPVKLLWPSRGSRVRTRAR